MSLEIPKIVTNAMASGTWRNPGSDCLRRFLKCNPDCPDLQLFDSIEVMHSVWSQLDTAGYPDDPEFHMTRLRSHRDDKLVFDTHTVFIGDSIMAGEDVLIAVDSYDSSNTLQVFDWGEPITRRWVACGTLADLVEYLSVTLQD